MSELFIRPYQADDAEAVWQLHNHALEGTGAHVGNGAWDADVRDPGKSYLEKGGQFLVALIEGAVAGMGAYLPVSEDSVEIKRMRVMPNAQGSGIGKQVLIALEQDAVKNGFNTAVLETTIQQVPAQKLYENHGYQSTHQSKMGRFEILHYRKSLC
ncbi:MAG: GNAT family N-acetyltransferase [Pseudomonadota bacterium]